MKTLIDLRVLYSKETGQGTMNINNDMCDDSDYILWLEDIAIKKLNCPCNKGFEIQKP